MLRKDLEEEKTKRKRKAGIVLLALGIVLLVGFVLGFCQWKGLLKNHGSKTENATEEMTEETDAAQIPEEFLDETEDLKSETEEVEERPTATLWEDNGPDERDVPEEADAAYSQETIDTETTVETQGGTE